MPTKNSTYIVLGLILLILTAIGGYFLFQFYQSSQEEIYTSETTPKIELIPTDSPEETETIVPSSATSSTSVVTPVASVSGKVTPITTKTLTPTKTPTTTPIISSTGLTTYSSAEDNFSVEYSSKRKFSQDNDPTLYDDSGDILTNNSIKSNRYNFTYIVSKTENYNFAVHVTSNDLWAWKNTTRQFDSDSLVAGKPSFRYDIASQTIVDVQSGDKNYTIQCVHNGVASYKTECESFISSFKLL